jgi:hypothetical protein
VGHTLSCYGHALGSVPAGCGGTWLATDIAVSSAQIDGYAMLPSSQAQAGTFGDLGGPCFYEGQIAGVQSDIDVNCATVPSGQTCGPQVATSFNFMMQASASYAASWMTSITSPTPAAGSVTGGLSVIASTSFSKGSFELVAPASPPGKGLVHYERDNGAAGKAWIFAETFAGDVGAFNGAVVIESSWGTLEVVAAAGSQVYAYSKPVNGSWTQTLAIPGANVERGTPGFVQSTYTPSPGSRGNFEVAVPNATGGIDYFWRDNSTSAQAWHVAPPTLFPQLGLVDDVVLFESKQGTMEMAARVGSSVYVMTRSASPFTWGQPTLVDSTAIGRPAYFQSNFGQNGNYELFVPSSVGGDNEYWRDNDDPNTPWVGPRGTFRASGMRFGSACAFETSLGVLPGDMELFGISGTDVLESRREKARASTPRAPAARPRDPKATSRRATCASSGPTRSSAGSAARIRL